MSDLFDFFNPISKNNRIFTQEDIDEMSIDDFTKNEKAIHYQWGKTGIPSDRDLLNSGEVTAVKSPYEKKPKFMSIFGTPTDTIPQIPDESVPITYRKKQSNNTPSSDNILFDKDKFIGIEAKQELDKLINRKIVRKANPEASKFWNISSQGIDKNLDYINQNGKVYNSINDLELPEHYKTHMKNKVQSQFGLDDTRGIVFNENSSISEEISKSRDLKRFINQNSEKLRRGENIPQSSISFEGVFNDLHSAIGKADVLNAQVNDGYLNMTIGDTYDFNPDSDNPLVQKGRRAQEAGLLEPYYSYIKIRHKLPENF